MFRREITAAVKYGQGDPMESDAMARTLDAQARAIWPLEKPFLSRIFTQSNLNVLDVGCGTGEISSRLVNEFSPKHITGLDLSEANLQRAREQYSTLERAGKLTFQQGNAMQMPFGDSEFDVAVCRHMLQAVPEPTNVIREMLRVVKPNGWLYFLAEDYGMLFFHPTKFDTDEFWRDYAWKSAERAGSNLRHGRAVPSTLIDFACTDITVNYLMLDTFRVDRNLLADIFTSWRDGFDRWISQFAQRPIDEVRARFNDMIECTRRVDGFALWILPSILARVTDQSKRAANNLP